MKNPLLSEVDRHRDTNRAQVGWVGQPWSLWCQDSQGEEGMH